MKPNKALRIFSAFLAALTFCAAGHAAMLERSIRVQGPSYSLYDIQVDAYGRLYLGGSKVTWETSDSIHSSGFVYTYSNTGAQLATFGFGAGKADSYRTEAFAVNENGDIAAMIEGSGEDSGGEDFVCKKPQSGVGGWMRQLSGAGFTAAGFDQYGNVYVTGQLHYKPGWMTGGYDTGYNGATDAYLAKISSSGNVMWATFIGGSGDDYPTCIAVKPSGKVYVGGYTKSTKWVSNGYDTSQNGGEDGFVVKVSASGSHTWSTFVGGSGSDSVNGITVDENGFVYATGATSSSGWVSGGYDISYNNGGTCTGDGDAFVVKIAGEGQYLWSTYLGGNGTDYGSVVTPAPGGGVFVAGTSSSNGWVSGGFSTAYSKTDAFVAELTGTGKHVWSSYMGGQYLCAEAIATGQDGDRLFLAGRPASNSSTAYISTIKLRNGVHSGGWLAYE